jgi:restriction system protein
MSPHGIYLTTSGYTAEARAFAEGKQIHLRDSAQLLALIQTLPVEKQDEILKQITSGDYTTPSCPSCGVKLVSKTSRKANWSGQRFWGVPRLPSLPVYDAPPTSGLIISHCQPGTI